VWDRGNGRGRHNGDGFAGRGSGRQDLIGDRTGDREIMDRGRTGRNANPPASVGLTTPASPGHTSDSGMVVRSGGDNKQGRNRTDPARATAANGIVRPASEDLRPALSSSRRGDMRIVSRSDSKQRRSTARPVPSPAPTVEQARTRSPRVVVAPSRQNTPVNVARQDQGLVRYGGDRKTTRAHTQPVASQPHRALVQSSRPASAPAPRTYTPQSRAPAPSPSRAAPSAPSRSYSARQGSGRSSGYSSSASSNRAARHHNRK
jgi:hypothetical protein